MGLIFFQDLWQGGGAFLPSILNRVKVPLKAQIFLTLNKHFSTSTTSVNIANLRVGQKLFFSCDYRSKLVSGKSMSVRFEILFNHRNLFIISIKFGISFGSLGSAVIQNKTADFGYKFFYRQLGFLAFSLRFWPKMKQLLSICPDLFFKNSLLSLKRVKINYRTKQLLSNF